MDGGFAALKVFKAYAARGCIGHTRHGDWRSHGGAWGGAEPHILLVQGLRTNGTFWFGVTVLQWFSHVGLWIY